MDHPVSACIMEKREADEPNWKWDLQAAFHTHIHAHYKWSKAKKVDHKKVTGDSNWVIWPQCCHSGGHYSAYRCITAVTFASANQWDPARLDSFGAASTAVAPCSPVATPSSQQLWKAQLGNNLLLPSQLSATPAWLHDVLQTLLAGVERMDWWLLAWWLLAWWESGKIKVVGKHFPELGLIRTNIKKKFAINLQINESFITVAAWFECASPKNTLHRF